MSEMILIELIDAPEWNSRTTLDQAKLKELAASMDSEGQQSPILVESNNDRFLLVYGSRRLAAAKLNNWTEIKAEVTTPTNKVERIISNIIENVQRENLTPYELARACATLRAEGLSLKDTSDKLRITQAHVSNLDKLYTFLPDKVKESWQRDEPAATVGYLRDLLGETKSIPKEGPKRVKWEETTITEYEERANLIKEVTEGGGKVPARKAKKAGKGGGSAPETTYTVTATRYGDLVTALKVAKADPMAILACKYLVGDMKAIKGIINEPKPVKKPSKKKDKE